MKGRTKIQAKFLALLLAIIMITGLMPGIVSADRNDPHIGYVKSYNKLYGNTVYYKNDNENILKTPDSLENGEVDVKKNVTYNNDGTFDIELSAISKEIPNNPPMPLDIVLVLDFSGSISSTDFKTYLDFLRDSSTGFIRSILDQKENRNRMQIVTFNETVKTSGSFTSDYTQLNEWLYNTDNLGQKNRTYTQGAVNKANELLSERKSNNNLDENIYPYKMGKPIVIIISDGAPNAHQKTLTPSDTQKTGGGAAGDVESAAWALFQGNKLKSDLTLLARVNNESLLPIVYTVAVGNQASNDLSKAVLNPTSGNINAATGLENAIRTFTNGDSSLLSNNYVDSALTVPSFSDLNQSLNLLISRLGYDAAIKTSVSEPEIPGLVIENVIGSEFNYIEKINGDTGEIRIVSIDGTSFNKLIWTLRPQDILDIAVSITFRVGLKETAEKITDHYTNNAVENATTYLSKYSFLPNERNTKYTDLQTVDITPSGVISLYPDPIITISKKILDKNISGETLSQIYTTITGAADELWKDHARFVINEDGKAVAVYKITIENTGSMTTGKLSDVFDGTAGSFYTVNKGALEYFDLNAVFTVGDGTSAKFTKIIYYITGDLENSGLFTNTVSILTDKDGDGDIDNNDDNNNPPTDSASEEIHVLTIKKEIYPLYFNTEPDISSLKSLNNTWSDSESFITTADSAYVIFRFIVKNNDGASNTVKLKDKINNVINEAGTLYVIDEGEMTAVANKFDERFVIAGRSSLEFYYVLPLSSGLTPGQKHTNIVELYVGELIKTPEISDGIFIYPSTPDDTDDADVTIIKQFSTTTTAPVTTIAPPSITTTTASPTSTTTSTTTTTAEPITTTTSTTTTTGPTPTTTAAPVTTTSEPASTTTSTTITTAEPITTTASTTATTAELTTEAVVDNLIPLDNGWFAEDLGDGLFEIFDENGVPLGYVKIPDGSGIEDYDIVNNLIPLGEVRENPISPKTGDNEITIYLIAIIAVTAAGVAVFMRKRRNK